MRAFFTRISRNSRLAYRMEPSPHASLPGTRPGQASAVGRSLGSGRRSTWVAVLVFSGLTVVPAAWVYRAALPPEGVAARKAEYDVVDWATVRDDPSVKLTISWIGGSFWSSGTEGGWIEEMLEERFNVELAPRFMTGQAYLTKKPLMFASGDITDVIWSADPIHVQRDAYHGFLLPIPYEVFQTYCPDVVRAQNDGCAIGWLYTYYNGMNYGLPTKYLVGIYPPPGSWRMDWLENLGIWRVPDTLEEMHDALYAISHGDPDGNGRNDTYGMSHDMSRHWWTSFSEVFGAYGIAPFDWMERDGKAVWGGLLPEVQEVLELLRQWYDEGLIDPDFVTDIQSLSVSQKFLNGRTGYQYASARYANYNPDAPGSYVSVLGTLDPNARIVPGRFPSGPRGHRGGRVWGPAGNAVCFGMHLAETPEKVVRVLRMFNEMMVDEELYLQTQYGRRGLHWDYADPDVGPHSGIQFLPPYDDSNVRNRCVIVPYFAPLGGTQAYEEKYLSREEWAFRKKHSPPEQGIADCLGKPDVVPSSPRHLVGLRNLQLVTYSKMIRGDIPLTDFKGFVARWYDEGGRKLTSEANELLQVKRDIYRQMKVEK